jgi:uncharacterized protein YbaR (Trm112 family)
VANTEKPTTVIEDKTKVTARVVGHVVCPFCNGELTCLEDVRNPARKGVLHSAPVCKTYEDNDPMEFLRAVRLEIAPETLS